MDYLFIKWVESENTFQENTANNLVIKAALYKSEVNIS